eukprot:TRINITY_DN26653_c0_g1_i1.p1 TRINITY_DN26653_c0_g1~~TRINITY_DN26653_c0_g1_i1.p1  ORF type:complete len:332 (+),score=100.76 TRINITY_DN26653_c0_g1_i1:139-1134(+)
MDIRWLTEYLRLPRSAIVGLVACTCYSATSLIMTFTNKALLSTYNLQYPLFVLVYQNVFTLSALALAVRLDLLKLPPMRVSTLVRWYPVNILFLIMLASASYALRVLSVPMVTIFKNFATVLVTLGDMMLFRSVLTPPIFCAVIMILFGSVVAGLNDLSYNGAGYVWMAINCAATVAYVLYMRQAIKYTQLSEWGMVYYNNMLSLPIMIPMVAISGELSAIGNIANDLTPGLVFMLLLSGVASFVISVSSFWAVRTTSPTTYSMVGALNKIPLTLLSFVFFDTPINFYGAAAIFISLSGGLLYSFGKSRSMERHNSDDVLPQQSGPLLKAV